MSPDAPPEIDCRVWRDVTSKNDAASSSLHQDVEFGAEEVRREPVIGKRWDSSLQLAFDLVERISWSYRNFNRFKAVASRESLFRRHSRQGTRFTTR
ncbi:MAG TPA: hypothetical protein VGC06_29810 [Actinomycetes bacterium]